MVARAGAVGKIPRPMPPEDPAPESDRGRRPPSVDRRHRRTRHRWKGFLSHLSRCWFLGWLLLAALLTWLAVSLLDRYR